MSDWHGGWWNFSSNIIVALSSRHLGAMEVRLLRRPKDSFNKYLQTTRMPYSCTVLLLLCLSQKIRITSVLAVFLKLGQMDFSKASNSISHHLTSIFPENCQICWVGGLVGLGGLGYLRGSCGLSARRARRTKSGPEGPPTRSRGPEGP